MKLISFIFAAFILTGCITGGLEITESTFDGSTQVVSPQGNVYKATGGFSGADISLQAYRNSNMPEGEVIIRAFYNFGIENIAALRFNIDGEIVSLEPAQVTTEFEHGDFTSESVRNFEADMELIKRMLNSDKTTVRLDFLKSSYVEGVFTDKTISSAYNAFEKFYNHFASNVKGEN